jgi:hypothetical protein
MNNKILVSASLAVLGTLTISNSATAINVLPDNLNPGDSYRLVFVSRNETVATSSDINFYNQFVQEAADNSSLSTTMDELDLCGNDGCQWKAIASTETIDARDNTLTNPNVSTGVPIYLVETLELIATNNLDLWDMTIEVPIVRDENGLINRTGVWTGTIWWGAPPNGLSGGRVGYLGDIAALKGSSSFSDYNWIYSNNEGSSEGDFDWFFTNNPYSVYALSEILTVPEPIPEPLTILGTATALGIGALFKRKNTSVQETD